MEISFNQSPGRLSCCTKTEHRSLTLQSKKRMIQKDDTSDDEDDAKGGNRIETKRDEGNHKTGRMSLLS